MNSDINNTNNLIEEPVKEKAPKKGKSTKKTSKTTSKKARTKAAKVPKTPKKRKPTVHSEAFKKKQFKQRVIKWHGGEKVFNFMQEQWLDDLNRAKKQQVFAYNERKQIWQDEHPGQVYTEPLEYANLPELENYDIYYYERVYHIREALGVSTQVAKDLYTETNPGSTTLTMQQRIDRAENELENKRQTYNEQATGKPGQSTTGQKDYAETLEWAKQVEATDYWELAEAAAEGRYEEALNHNIDYLQGMIKDIKAAIISLKTWNAQLAQSPQTSDVVAQIAYNNQEINNLTAKIQTIDDLLAYNRNSKNILNLKKQGGFGISFRSGKGYKRKK